MIQVVIALLVAHLFHPVFHRRAAGAGSQVQLHLVQADRFRGHDLVVFAVLQHAVLVNAGGVGEGAGADDGLVRRDRHIADLADGLAGAPDFMMINVGVHVHDVFAHFDRHDHFFQRAVAGAFADTVHRTFYLARTGVDRGEGVTDSDAQIIMGVDGNNCFVDIRHAIIQAADDVGIFERHGIADGIRDINGGGAGVDRRFHDASQIGNRRTAGVFTGELNVVSVVACPLHHIDRALNNLIQRTAQFGGDMHRRGGNKGMNTESLGHF